MAVYDDDKPTPGGAVISEPVRDNFKALSHLSQLRARSVLENNDNASSPDADHKIHVNSGWPIFGDEIKSFDEETCDITNLSGWPGFPSSGERLDVLAITRTSVNAQNCRLTILPGQAGSGEPPALPKSAFSVAILKSTPNGDPYTDDRIIDVRFHNVAGSDMHWNSGPTFQQGRKEYPGTGQTSLPNGMTYQVGSGNLNVYFGEYLGVKGTHYEEVDESTIDIINEPNNYGGTSDYPNEPSLRFEVLSGDSVVRYYNNIAEYTVQSSDLNNPNGDWATFALNFWYTKGAEALKIFNQGRLASNQNRVSDSSTVDPEWREYTGANEGEQTNLIELNVNHWDDGSRLDALNPSIFKDIAHQGTHYAGGSDELLIENLASNLPDDALLQVDSQNGEVIAIATNPNDGDFIVWDGTNNEWISTSSFDADTVDGEDATNFATSGATGTDVRPADGIRVIDTSQTTPPSAEGAIWVAENKT